MSKIPLGDPHTLSSPNKMNCPFVELLNEGRPSDCLSSTISKRPYQDGLVRVNLGDYTLQLVEVPEIQPRWCDPPPGTKTTETPSPRI